MIFLLKYKLFNLIFSINEVYLYYCIDSGTLNFFIGSHLLIVIRSLNPLDIYNQIDENHYI